MLTNFLLCIIRARYLVFGLAIVWAVAGVWFAFRTPIDALPDISENQVLVYSPWPNHNPPEIYAQVSRPLASALQDIPGLVSIRGSSDVGFSLLYLIFDPSVKYATARERVAQRLEISNVSLPAGVNYELAPEGIPTGQIVWYTLSGKDTDLMELRSCQDKVIAPRLRQLSGVAEVSSVGGFLPEVTVELDSQALAAHRLSVSEVMQPLRQQWPELVNSLDSALLSSTEFNETILSLEEFRVNSADGVTTRLGDLSRIQVQPAPRFGVFERDGNELVGGVVHLQAGRNPLEVTNAVLTELQTISDLLPSGYRITPCYDRIRLINGAVSTVTRTLFEALLVTTVCILFIMRHFRTSLVITLTLPLAVLGAFLGMQVLRYMGLNVDVNIMSLAGIAISIGVLVDASVVIVENVTFNLKQAWGEEPVLGNTDLLVARAAAMVAKPAILAVVIMLVSFLPIFALEGIDGQLVRPLAWTKTLTLLSVILLTLTLVPALCSICIRGRLRGEQGSWIVRSVVQVYRPVLTSVCYGSWVFAMLLALILILAASTTGSDWGLRIAVVVSIACVGLTVQRWSGRLAAAVFLTVIALSAQSFVRPIGMALRLPLDEGMIMDMPITLPRMTVSQAADDLKARNMLMCRFPEIHMVTGKAGRAETAFDPAPIDMIESMVEFRAMEKWPKRRLLVADARYHAAHVLGELLTAKLIEPPTDEARLLDTIVDEGLKRFDAIQRETCWHLLQSFERDLSKQLSERVALNLVAKQLTNDSESSAKLQPLSDIEARAAVEKLDSQDCLQFVRQLDSISLHVIARELKRILGADRFAPINRSDDKQLLRDLQSIARNEWKRFLHSENQILYRRAGAVWVQIVIEEICSRQAIVDEDFLQTRRQVMDARFAPNRNDIVHHSVDDLGHHAGIKSYSELPLLDPNPVYESIVQESAERFDRSVWLWQHTQDSLLGPRGELDQGVQMPGWANVWTRPIQNRIDMLATGVSSEVGVRVLGNDFETVVSTSDRIAKRLQEILGAADVIADPIRGKGYVKFKIKADAVSQRQLESSEVEVAVQAGSTGHLLEPLVSSASSERVTPLRLTIRPSENASSDRILDTPLALRTASVSPKERTEDADIREVKLVKLRELASLHHFDGPATIKSASSQLCNYVRLNVRGRDAVDWVEEAKAVLNAMELPPDVSIEWTGQFVHASRTRDNLLWIVPICVILIVAILLVAFHDIADAMLMLTSVPGALAGGAIAQWVLGYPFSVSVGVGYLACFGMAAATSMVMIIYLRQSLSDAGGLSQIVSLDELRECIIRGAVHRIRPKLLTEVTMVLSLAPLLWSTGVGADVIRPMAAPVLGGILIADEIVDLLIPSLFFAVRRRRWLQSRTPALQSPSAQ